MTYLYSLTYLYSPKVTICLLKKKGNYGTYVLICRDTNLIKQCQNEKKMEYTRSIFTAAQITSISFHFYLFVKHNAILQNVKKY